MPRRGAGRVRSRGLGCDRAERAARAEFNESDGHDERAEEERAQENVAHADDAPHHEHAGTEHSAGSRGELIPAPAGDDVHDEDEDERGAEEEVVESVGGDDALEEVPERPPPSRRQYKIQEVIKRRQIMLVQVVKEERGNKGAALTTYLSLAGRYCVLMPNTARGGGISPQDHHGRRPQAPEGRSCRTSTCREGMGLILRTAGATRTKAEIKRDYEYLMRLWENVRELTLHSIAPALIYEEGDLVKRAHPRPLQQGHRRDLVEGDDGYQRGARLHAHADAEPGQEGEPYREPTPLFVAHRRREPARRDVLADRARCGPAAISSSTRPRRWSPSTSTPAARPASTTSRTPRSRPTWRRPRKSPASCACATSPA